MKKGLFYGFPQSQLKSLTYHPSIIIWRTFFKVDVLSLSVVKYLHSPVVCDELSSAFRMREHIQPYTPHTHGHPPPPSHIMSPDLWVITTKHRSIYALNTFTTTKRNLRLTHWQLEIERKKERKSCPKQDKNRMTIYKN